MRSTREPVYEMIGRPGPGHLHLAILHHCAGCGELVLIALHVLAIDQVGDIENHFASLGEAAADFFIKRGKQPMHLEGHRTGSGLAFALACGRLAQIGKISAPNLVGRELSNLSNAAVVYKDLEVHLGFAAKFVDVAKELALIGSDGFAEAIVVVENGAESERKDGGMFKAISDDSCVVYTGFLV